MNPSNKKFLAAILLLTLLAGCYMPGASTPTPDLFATLQASTPSGFTPPAGTEQFATPNFNVAPPTFTSLPAGSVPSPLASDQLTGKIVFTCQVNKVTATDQICIMNADGSGFRQLTSNSVRHYYPSLSPDGTSVIYAAFREQNVYEIYEYELNDGTVNRLTNRIGVSNAPEISPDGNTIAF
ncbi:MAG TPA: hypothetical protein VMJ90_04470, partial [Anaerolineales bacterium]|nr:hypothetical protein [Anaerolineales bacterium]